MPNLDKIVLAALLWATAAGEASAAETERFTVTGMQIVRHHGERLSLVVGTNNIDKPHEMVCKSQTGCTMVVHSVTHMFSPNDSYAVCAPIDEKPAEPACSPVNSYDAVEVAFQGGGHLAPGPHTVRTAIQMRHTQQLTSYQFLYTMYEH